MRACACTCMRVVCVMCVCVCMRACVRVCGVCVAVHYQQSADHWLRSSFTQKSSMKTHLKKHKDGLSGQAKVEAAQTAAPVVLVGTDGNQVHGLWHPGPFLYGGLDLPLPLTLHRTPPPNPPPVPPTPGPCLRNATLLTCRAVFSLHRCTLCPPCIRVSMAKCHSLSTNSPSLWAATLECWPVRKIGLLQSSPLASRWQGYPPALWLSVRLRLPRQRSVSQRPRQDRVAPCTPNNQLSTTPPALRPSTASGCWLCRHPCHRSSSGKVSSSIREVSSSSSSSSTKRRSGDDGNCCNTNRYSNNSWQTKGPQ